MNKEQLEVALLREPENISILCRLSNLYLAENKPQKSLRLIETATAAYHQSLANVEDGIKIVDASLAYWRADRFVNKGTMRLNVMAERKMFLANIYNFVKPLRSLKLKDQTDLKHLLALRTAYILECMGLFQESLSILSDLITDQAMNEEMGIDLSYIVFKASVLLQHTDNTKQSIEYLEFLLDDPPVRDGYGKAHVVAFLTAAYELG